MDLISQEMTLSLYRTALRAVLSDDLNCSSSLATRIQKKQPLFEAAEDKNSMHHKRVARKQVSHFVLVLCFNHHQCPRCIGKGPTQHHCSVFKAPIHKGGMLRPIGL